MSDMILDLENRILDQILQEGKDPIDDALKETIAEWRQLQKDFIVIDKIAKAVSSRVGELETDMADMLKQMNSKKTVVDGVIIEFIQKKGNKTVKYKEALDYTLKMVNEAQQRVILAFVETVTNPGELRDVLVITDPEIEKHLLQVKKVSGMDMFRKMGSMARTVFSKLPKLFTNSVKRELKEGVEENLSKVIKNLVRRFKTVFKPVFKAIDASDKAVDALVKAVKAPDTVEESLVLEDQNYTDFNQWKSACSEGRSQVWFDGDNTECSAYQGEQPFQQGQTVLVGSWNGKTGTAQAPSQQSESLDLDLDKGAFHKWLGKKEGDKLTDSDIAKGLKSDDPHVVKMAEFAKNSKKWRHEAVSEAKTTEEKYKAPGSLISNADMRKLTVLKDEFRKYSDEIDNLCIAGTPPSHDDKLMKKAKSASDKLKAFNAKMKIPRPSDM